MAQQVYYPLIKHGFQEKDLYSLPVAGADTLGGVKVGSGLSIDENGVLGCDTLTDTFSISNVHPNITVGGAFLSRFGWLYGTAELSVSAPVDDDALLFSLSPDNLQNVVPYLDGSFDGYILVNGDWKLTRDLFFQESFSVTSNQSFAVGSYYMVFLFPIGYVPNN